VSERDRFALHMRELRRGVSGAPEPRHALRLYRIDDGAQHWIAADSYLEALALLIATIHGDTVRPTAA
jgi:hypothetical protein